MVGASVTGTSTLNFASAGTVMWSGGGVSLTPGGNTHITLVTLSHVRVRSSLGANYSVGLPQSLRLVYAPEPSAALLLLRAGLAGLAAAGRRARRAASSSLGCLAVALGFAFAPPSADATTLASETFAYGDGSLYGQSGGSGWLGIWTGFGTNVSGGEAVGASPNSVGWSGSRFFDNPGTSPVLFVSLDFRTPASVSLADSFGVVLGAGVNSSNVVIGKGPGDSVFSAGNVGFFFPSSVTVLPSTTYHLIGAYDLVNQRVSLWIDPDGGDYYDVASGTSSADVSALSSVAFHMNYVVMGGTLELAAVDNLVIGNAPADVGLLAAPEPAASAVLFATLVSFVAGARERSGSRRSSE